MRAQTLGERRLDADAVRRRIELARGLAARLAVLLRQHPRLHGKAPRRRRAAPERVVQRRALGERELDRDEIDARDFLGHGVLDLQARVALHEVEAVSVDQELEGAEAL